MSERYISQIPPEEYINKESHIDGPLGNSAEKETKKTDRWKRLTNTLLSSTLALTLVGAGKQGRLTESPELRPSSDAPLRHPKEMTYGNTPEETQLSGEEMWAIDSMRERVMKQAQDLSKWQASVRQNPSGEWVIVQSFNAEDANHNTFSVEVESESDNPANKPQALASTPKLTGLAMQEKWKALRIKEFDRDGTGSISTLTPTAQGIHIVTRQMDHNQYTSEEVTSLDQDQKKAAEQYFQDKDNRIIDIEKPKKPQP